MKNIRTIYIVSDKQDEAFIRSHELLKSDGIIFLSGWEGNHFSILEKEIALFCGKTIVKVRCPTGG